MGWFYGLKLHFVINHKGQIMALKITPGNTADSTVLDAMTQHLAGTLYADKGYIGRELFSKLWLNGGTSIPVSPKVLFIAILRLRAVVPPFCRSRLQRLGRIVARKAAADKDHRTNSGSGSGVG